MSIAVENLQEGWIVSNLVVGDRVLPPGLCTKVKKEKDGTFSFRIENAWGSFWKHGLAQNDKIDGASIRNFLKRL